MTTNIYLNFLSQINLIEVNLHYHKRLIKCLETLIKRQPHEKIAGIHHIHHIIPRSWSSDDKFEKENYLLITSREHYIVHHLMWKAFPHDKPMMVAFKSMACGWGSYKNHVSSRIYEKLIKQFSKSMKGNGIHGYGKGRIRTLEEIENHRRKITGRKQSEEHVNKRKMIGDRNPMKGKIGEKHHLFGSSFKWATDGNANRRMLVDSSLPDSTWRWGMTFKNR